ncbi:histidine kinase [Candidatus Thiomargarita nelsonii]|uniref:histidine kinase n=1 Tax=Candidatus Thiomargarita nelsonii TaxID=1003181 RepID=A0A0A6PDU6_9GAMM|nr:histidine kinase [Candidatus Thiomargarita nelsonii]
MSHSGMLLIVDDKATNLKMLFTYLRSLNFKVLVAQNGSEVLIRVDRVQPDIILLDVMMPTMDGFETCSRLKANEKTRDIPVIFMTARTETVDKVKGFELGAVDYIAKPVQQEEVLARINAHLKLRKLQTELENKNIELQQQNDELEAFGHTVAHDLKNPLTSINGYLDYILEDFSPELDSEVLEVLQNVKKSGSKMVNIIDALLLLASSRHLDVAMAPLNMGKIVSHVQQRLSYMMRQYEANIIMPSDWLIARGYAPWIEEVWTNYISNGLKYGGSPPLLKLGVSPDANGYIRFWVHDNGQGLTPEQQSRLFVPFSRIGQSRVEGHGLGLSIVQRIVEKSGGQVGVESQVGQGSTFYFTLPANV